MFHLGSSTSFLSVDVVVIVVVVEVVVVVVGFVLVVVVAVVVVLVVVLLVAMVALDLICAGLNIIVFFPLPSAPKPLLPQSSLSSCNCLTRPFQNAQFSVCLGESTTWTDLSLVNLTMCPAGPSYLGQPTVRWPRP